MGINQNTNLPDWFLNKMKDEFGPDWDEWDIMEILLGDYLKRNTPCSHMVETRSFWDSDKEQEISRSVCVNCNQVVRTEVTAAPPKRVEVVKPKFSEKATIRVVCKHTDHLMDKHRLKVGRSYLVLDISKCKQYYRMKDDYGNLSYFSVERFR